MSLWNSLLGPFAMPDWTPAPKTVPAAATVESASADPMTAPSPVRVNGGRDAEPEHLRIKRERVQAAEVARDLALADYQLALAIYRDQQPKWQAEP